MHQTDQQIRNLVINWFEKAVLGLNLCPFAAKPYRQGLIRFEMSHANDDESCLTDLLLNLTTLEQYPHIETLVLIIPGHLISFSDYNEFLSLTDLLLEQQGWRGMFQIASFHPDYCFADCEVNDRANWTNRSPFPLLHLIRETSISKAVTSHPDVDGIPGRNVEVLKALSEKEMMKVFGSD